MNGVDTNVLIRYLTGDDPEQAARARELMLRVRDTDDQLLVSDIVLCEVVWVLRTAYGLDKPDVVATLDKLLSTRQLEFADRDLVRLALADFRASSADFADCLLGRRNHTRTGSPTWTFDRGTQALSYFRML
jgi:predicted nucleic-acid-binding protein